MIHSNDTDTSPLTQDPITPEESVFELSLRPQNLQEYIGQAQVKRNLSIALEAAKLRNEPLDHVLLYGPPGLGKTTLANIIAKETNRTLRISSGASLQRAGDLAAILTNLEEGDVFFIDEIHRLNPTAEEILYPAIEDGVLDILVGKGPGARSIRMQLPKFTLVGATTRVGMISNPLRDRFGHIFHLEYYTPEELQVIISRSSELLQYPIDPTASTELASRSRGTPRIANRLLKRTRDFTQITGDRTITQTHVASTLEHLGVDFLGLDRGDTMLLETIIHKFNGGPVGLQTLAIATGEAEDTITDIYEPYLIRQGLLDRTPKGRIATQRAYTHLGVSIE
ncbi:MAG: Holliday junction branch migration DNA helicase RuvB [Candidatus Doudnabacteria bacterium]|nr:Holliday junction branch migration DNA helicase RuvB [Candidatus Doudnabacteria bacterium]